MINKKKLFGYSYIMVNVLLALMYERKTDLSALCK